MQDVLFYILAGFALACGFLVIANPFSRNPVTSAMFLVLTVGALAGLFILLHAFFLAAVQIIVYAGAVIVLFLFVIMLLDVPEEERRRIRVFWMVLSLLVVGSIAALLVMGIVRSGLGHEAQPQLEGATQSLGRLLFTEFLVPFEIVSLVLLVAIVGVVLLSKRELK